MSPQSITILIHDHVNHASHREYENWLGQVHEEIRKFEGFQWVEVKGPIDWQNESGNYQIIYRFDKYESFESWFESPFLKQKLIEARYFFNKDTKMQQVEGIEMFYDHPSFHLSAKKPRYWKQVVMTIALVYPLILLVDFLLKILFPMQQLSPPFALFCTVVIVASTLVKPVMPWASRLLHRWLH